MNGILLVDKPSGPTSFDVVRVVRKALHTRKVGHCGTLDPMASGLLVVCANQGTKLVPYLMDSPKTYIAKIKLGYSTNTNDAMGEVLKKSKVPALSAQQIKDATLSFVGKILQVPPLFSAIKRDGEALYHKARRGEQIKLEAREVFVSSINVLQFSHDELEIEVICGKGTYIRSIARDLAIKLGTTGHLSFLRRTATSGYNVNDAVAFDDILKLSAQEELKSKMFTLSNALVGFNKITLNEDDEKLVSNGCSIEMAHYKTGLNIDENKLFCLLDRQNELRAIASLNATEYSTEKLKIIRGFPPDNN